MRIVFLILAIFICFSCSWTKAEITKEACWMVLHVIDYKQTQYAMDRPDEFSELNPMLGDHPSEGRLNTFAVVGGVTHFLTTHYFDGFRGTWQNVTLGLKVAVVGNNFHVGAKVEF